MKTFRLCLLYVNVPTLKLDFYIGSTWLQEMVWLIANDLDFDKAKGTIQQLRAPMIE